MSIPKKIRRFWMWVGIIMLIELVAITLWKRWYWFFPSYSVSELYTKYAGKEGLDVAFVKDYRINDSVSADVTMLEANDTATWNKLLIDFNLHIPDEALPFIDTNTVLLKYAPHDNYTAPMDSVILNNDIIVYAYLKRTILVFKIDNKKQIDAILHKQILNTHPKNDHNE